LFEKTIMDGDELGEIVVGGKMRRRRRCKGRRLFLR
jgi:hypothetical protein